MSLSNPTVKMSKSDILPNSRININDSNEHISTKIKRATVDSTLGITYSEDRPGS